MPYNPNFTPDAPLPISMLPDAEPLSLDDLLLVTQPGNTTSRSRRLSLLSFLSSPLFNSAIGFYFSEQPDTGDWNVDLSGINNIATLYLKPSTANKVYLQVPSTGNYVVTVVVDWGTAEYLDVYVGNNHPEILKSGTESLALVISNGGIVSYTITNRDPSQAEQFTASVSVKTPAVGNYPAQGSHSWLVSAGGFTFKQFVSGVAKSASLAWDAALGWVIDGIGKIKASSVECDELNPKDFDLAYCVTSASGTGDYSLYDPNFESEANMAKRFRIIYNTGAITKSIKYWKHGNDNVSSPDSVNVAPGECVCFIWRGVFFSADLKMYGQAAIIGR